MYELDGLKEGPIALGEASESDWLEKVVPVIQVRERPEKMIKRPHQEREPWGEKDERDRERESLRGGEEGKKGRRD